MFTLGIFYLTVFPRETIWIFSFKNNLSNQLATMPRKPRHTSFYAMSRLLKVSLNFSKQLSIETYHYIFRREILVNIFQGLFFYRCQHFKANFIIFNILNQFYVHQNYFLSSYSHVYNVLDVCFTFQKHLLYLLLFLGIKQSLTICASLIF